MIPFQIGGDVSGEKSKTSYNETTSIDDWLRKRQEGLLASAEGNLPQNYTPTSAAQIGAQMNPYQDQVINRLYANADQGRRGVSNFIGDRATAAGAFGGSRHGVAQGVALGEFDTGLNDQVAGLLYGGYQDAANRATDENRFGYGYGMERYGLLGDLLSRITPETTTSGSSKSSKFGWNLSGKVGTMGG